MPSRSHKSWISSTFIPNPTHGTAPWPDIQWGNHLNPECCVNLIAVGIWDLLVMNQLSHWCPNEGWEGVIPPTGSDEGQQFTGTDGLRKENLELSPFHLQDRVNFFHLALPWAVCRYFNNFKRNYCMGIFCPENCHMSESVQNQAEWGLEPLGLVESVLPCGKGVGMG